MVTLWKSPSDIHFIDRGWVYCPERKADVESDVCAGCERMLQMQDREPKPFVRCRPPASVPQLI